MEGEGGKLPEDPFLTRMEFSVQMSDGSCEALVRSKLEKCSGVQAVFVSVSDDLVLVDSVLPTSQVQALLESTGLLVFFKGFGSQQSTISPSSQPAAVAILKGKSQEVGLVRMVQTPSSCVIEATVDKLAIGEYSVGVHQLGDLSSDGYSCGDVYSSANEVPPAGNLGNIQVGESGSASLHVYSRQLKVFDIIGRSVVVSDADGKRLLCGVIARSAGLFQNSKRLCSCDGVTIWDEASRNR